MEIPKLKEKINESNGHLPLLYRVKLMRFLGDANTVNKIFLECCKMIYIHFKIKDDYLSEILSKAQKALYNGQSINFETIGNKNKNYIEAISEQPYAGVASSVLSLCFSLAYHAEQILNIEDYKDQDDDFYDWEGWNPDFFASNTFSGGSPFLKTGNITHRKEFWKWYLETAQKISKSPDTPVSPVITFVHQEKSDNIIIRNQHLSDEINSKIRRSINLVIKDIEKNISKTNIKKIEIEGEVMKNGKSIRALYFLNNGEKKKANLTFYLYRGDDSSIDLMVQVRNLMYVEEKIRGAWLSFKITTDLDINFSIEFNYDDIKKLPERKRDLSCFISEFKDAPRSKKFTPNWWQEIVEKNNLSYLE